MTKLERISKIQTYGGVLIIRIDSTDAELYNIKEGDKVNISLEKIQNEIKE